MPVTVDDLATSIQQFFASHFPLGGDGGAGSMMLMFDPLGFPLSTNEFGASSPPHVATVMAHQRAAELADQIPAANALAQGSYLPRGGSKLSRWYLNLVRGSAGPPASAVEERAAFDAAKADALRELMNNELVLVSSPGGSINPAGVNDTYYATSMTPVDWYAPAFAGWQHYSVKAADNPAPQGRPPWYIPIPQIKYRRLKLPDQVNPFPHHIHVLPTSVTDYIRVATESERHVEIEDGHTWSGGLIDEARIRDHARLRVFTPALAGRVVVAVTPLSTHVGAPNTRLLNAFLTADTESQPRSSIIVMPAEEDATSRPVEGWRPTFSDVVGEVSAVESVMAATVATGSSSSNFSLSFDYCLVRFDRPWWDDVFLNRRDIGRCPATTPTSSAAGKQHSRKILSRW